MEKRIEGYEEYAITENGRVISYNLYAHKQPRELKFHKSSNGYLYVDLSKNHTAKRFAIHRLVAKHYCGGYFEGAVVNHKDANVTNNHYTNLEWVTQKENVNKSYETSGKGAMRNYRCYKLKVGEIIIDTIFEGSTNLKNFLQKEHPDCSVTSLLKYRKTKNYELIVL